MGPDPSTVLDTSGKFSYDQRLQAYSSLFEMGVKDKLRGMDTDNAKQYWQAIMYSDIGTRAAQLQQQGVSSMISAAGRGESPAGAQLKFFAGLSEQDQKTDFTVTANSFTFGGNRQYANIDSYRDQLVANASVDAPDGAAQALKTLSPVAAGNNWGAQVLGLFQSAGSSRSDGDSKNVSAVSHTLGTPKLPMSYQPGGIYSHLA